MLVDDQDAVAVLAQQVADRIGIPVSHIEKDFWVTEVLHGAVATAADGGLEVVFKGGTSLSKAFRLIQRFSEDVDLLVVIPGSLGTGAADTKLKLLVNGASAATGLRPEAVPAATSKGVKRGARFHYRRNDDRSGLSAGVFLEIGSRGDAMPATLIAVKSILAEHAPQQLADYAESEPVHVRVLDPCRTLVEKLVLLHTAHMSPDPHDAIRGARTATMACICFVVNASPTTNPAPATVRTRWSRTDSTARTRPTSVSKTSSASGLLLRAIATLIGVSAKLAAASAAARGPNHRLAAL